MTVIGAEFAHVIFTRELLFLSGNTYYQIGGQLELVAKNNAIHRDLGELGADRAWWEVPLPPCPDCKGSLVWAEAGYVPGTRQCSECSSLFSVSTSKN